MESLTPYQFQKLTESFCKLKSTCGIHNDLDIHGQYWSERAVLKVIAYDRTYATLIVENANGLRWQTDLTKVDFCLENGNRISDFGKEKVKNEYSFYL